MLKQRVITALVLVILLGLDFYFLSLASLKLVLVAIIFLAAKEWAKLSLVKATNLQWVYAFVIAVSAYFIESLTPANYLLMFLKMMSIGWLLTIVYLLFIIKKITKGEKTSLTWLFSGALVLTSTFIALSVILQQFDTNRLLILLLIAVVWITDSGAYFVGKTIGKHKFSPIVSPGKTWQGVVGGVALASIYGYFIAPFFTTENTIGFVALITLAAVVSVFGDLLESLHKRQSGFKDSGNILPGHGGVLDRVDSLLSYTPVIVVGLAYV